MKENISVEAGTCCTHFAERNLPQRHSLVLFLRGRPVLPHLVRRSLTGKPRLLSMA